MRIVEDHEYLDGDVWKSVKNVLNRLSVDGMSSDESDVEPSSSRLLDQRRVHNIKVVRRVRLPWLNHEISELFDAVETYDALRPPGAVPNKRGKMPYPRLFGAIRDSGDRAAKPRLPRNWYNDEWFKKSSRMTKIHLAPTEDVPIPALVCIFLSIA